MTYVSVVRAVLVGALLAWPLAGHAQDTVRVGQETKRSVGTITAMNAGDTACLLTLKDDKGARFDEPADFEICEQRALLNKRVALTYKLGNVMAPECQGDVNCKKSVRIALVVAAKPIAGTAPATPPAAPTTAPSSAAKGQTSFCTSAETVVFSCRTGAKMVSVCASKDAGPDRGYLQYRFGKPDSSEPLELVLPEARNPPNKAANGANEGYSGGGGAWLRFFNRPTTYTVYTGIGNWGRNGDKMIKEGLRIERDGKRVAEIPCAAKPISELGPDWFEKLGVKRASQEFFFSD